MSFTLSKLVEITGAKLVGDPSAVVCSVADLESATAEDVSFLANPLYTPLLDTTHAGVVCIDAITPVKEGKNYLITDDPSRLFQQIAEVLLHERTTSGFIGIHPTAIVHESVQLGESVTIGPYAVVDKGAVLGDGTVLAPFASVGPGTIIGKQCYLHPHSVVREHCQLGDRVILQPGAIVGSCGFGYATDKTTGTHAKIAQIGNVVIEDDVEIGANATIDRARFKTTRICKGTKIDNLVQIAHNVTIGEHNIIAAQTGIAGSTKTGRNVVMGGQVGVVGHLEIADFSMFAAKSGISKPMKTGKYSGSPVLPINEYNRIQVHTRRLASYVDRIAALEKQVEELAKLLPCS